MLALFAEGSKQSTIEDRTDVPTDHHHADLVLRSAEDPEVNWGSFAQDVRVGS